MTSTIMRRLAAPFRPSEIDWRPGGLNREKTKARALAYIDKTTVEERLDAVMNFDWQCRYPVVSSGGAGSRTVCEIGLLIGEEWIWRSDGAGDTDMEGEKGGLSDAFKRAAVRWGVGRYLYTLGSPWVPLKDGKYIPDELLKGDLYTTAAKPFANWLSGELAEAKDKEQWWADNVHDIRELPDAWQQRLRAYAEKKEAA